MAVTLSVGLQKKVGLPDYGSLGASCHVEFEIDRSLIDDDLDGFHQKVASAFAACRQAVNDQLVQQSAPSAPLNGNGHVGNRSLRQRQSPASEKAPANDSGQGTKPGAGTATQSQVRAIFAIARVQKVDPASLVRKRFDVDRLEDLSLREASTLIDELKCGAVELRS